MTNISSAVDMRRMKVSGLVRSLVLVVVAVSVCAITPGHAQSGYRPGAANLAAREWFQDARFGLFVHWGVYSVLGDGEWVMNNRRIPSPTTRSCRRCSARWNSIRWWVALAEAAGMKCITITSGTTTASHVRLKSPATHRQRTP